MTGACSLPCSQDALGLALSVANMQEEKALRKAEKHHQPQVTEALWSNSSQMAIGSLSDVAYRSVSLELSGEIGIMRTTGENVW